MLPAFFFVFLFRKALFRGGNIRKTELIHRVGERIFPAGVAGGGKTGKKQIEVAGSAEKAEKTILSPLYFSFFCCIIEIKTKAGCLRSEKSLGWSLPAEILACDRPGPSRRGALKVSFCAVAERGKASVETDALPVLSAFRTSVPASRKRSCVPVSPDRAGKLVRVRESAPDFYSEPENTVHQIFSNVTRPARHFPVPCVFSYSMKNFFFLPDAL